MYGDPAAWHRFADKLATVVADYLVAQIDAGVDAVQVFDSWVGALNADDYREFALPHTRKIFGALEARGVPTIHFGVGTGAILPEHARSRRRRHRRRLAHSARRGVGRASATIAAIQGNLDPTLLLGPRERLLNGAADVLARAAGRPGHIFNLGHGILPSTPVENVQALARFVHQTHRQRAVTIVDRRRRHRRTRRPAWELRCQRGRRRRWCSSSAPAPGRRHRHRDTIDGFVIDGGPDSLLVQKPAAIDLCRELGLGDRLVPDAAAAHGVRPARRPTGAAARGVGAGHSRPGSRRSSPRAVLVARQSCAWRWSCRDRAAARRRRRVDRQLHAAGGSVRRP